MRIKLLLGVVAFCLGSMAAEEMPDLTGRVLEPDGQAITNASVFIYTAGPRVGPGYI